MALKIVANNIKYVSQLTGFFFCLYVFLPLNIFYFYCNLFCYSLTYLFIYFISLLAYFLLCINVVNSLSIIKKMVWICKLYFTFRKTLIASINKYRGKKKRT